MKIHSKSSKLFFFFAVKSSPSDHCFALGTVYSNTQCCYTVSMHWKDWSINLYLQLTRRSSRRTQSRSSGRFIPMEKQRQTHTQVQTRLRAALLQVLIPHLGKDHFCTLGFPSSYFRLHGHNVVWEREQYIIEAFLTKPVTFCFGFDLWSVKVPTSHAICVISQIKFYSQRIGQIYCILNCSVLY